MATVRPPAALRSPPQPPIDALSGKPLAVPLLIVLRIAAREIGMRIRLSAALLLRATAKERRPRRRLGPGSQSYCKSINHSINYPINQACLVMLHLS